MHQTRASHRAETTGGRSGEPQGTGPDHRNPRATSGIRCAATRAIGFWRGTAGEPKPAKRRRAQDRDRAPAAREITDVVAPARARIISSLTLRGPVDEVLAQAAGLKPVTLTVAPP